MQVKASVRVKIERVIQVFETGTVEPNYGYLVVYQDGRKVRGQKTMQITYGKMQTTEQGHLAELIEMYCNQPGAKYAKMLDSFLPKIGIIPLYSNSTFKKLLVAASEDAAMKSAQDLFFDKYYWQPCIEWCKSEGFALPLSILAIYDSFVHSGSIMRFLRNKFTEKTPSFGGDEKKWITEYIKARDKWLEFNEDKLLQKTDYRTDCILEQLGLNNWNLEKSITVIDGNGKFKAKVV